MNTSIEKQSDAGATDARRGATLDVIIVGAGFAGISSLYKFRDVLGYSVKVFEAAGGPGGVWWWNRYPGARCDLESMQYCYSFSEELQQEWNWSERFAAQPEILAYLEHVVERFDLARDIAFNTRVLSAKFDEQNALWNVTTDQGKRCSARYLVMAAGPLSTPHMPDYPGLDTFSGDVYHTGQWPHEAVYFSGKRVAVIGTGSSGTQVSPEIARVADKVYVMQRTAAHAIPMRNRPLGEEEVNQIKSRYSELRKLWTNTPGGVLWRSLPTDELVVTGDQSALEVTKDEREQTFERAWAYGGYAFHRSFNDLLVSEESSQLANEFIGKKIRELVTDEKTAALLQPKILYGTKRVILDNGYYEMFNRPNVSLVDVKEDAITGFTPTGIATQQNHYEVDAVVFATGFDALTGSLVRMDVRGRGGRCLQEVWADGPVTNLGVMVEGFPNMFIIGGPQSPSALANVVVANEQQLDWIADCISYMERQGAATIESELEAQHAWVSHVDEIAGNTIFTKGDNWYLGSNIKDKPRVFLLYIGGFPQYVEECRQVAEKGYQGFSLLDAAGSPVPTA